jgi:hypothetical protein
MHSFGFIIFLLFFPDMDIRKVLLCQMKIRDENQGYKGYAGIEKQGLAIRAVLNYHLA